ncbi:MAG: 2-oxoacid:acceptor oxidoreductase family protein [Myxococcota bacterium]|nr:2-oxoacid:acceptor oxidoreductase family protein [Myxococcota bacterium]
MYRIRLHGRGGQGMKTASRIIGSAFFAEGFEVQDAPRYGAERRGAPIFAYVRASLRPILERGVIRRPDLVVVADESLVQVPAAGVLQGIDEHSLLLLDSLEPAEVWQERLKLQGPVLTMGSQAEGSSELPTVGARCAGAAARLVGVISRSALEGAIREELAGLGDTVVASNLETALASFDAFASDEGRVCPPEEAQLAPHTAPAWVDVPHDAAGISAPDVHGAATSVQVRTGLWRTVRPEIDAERCHGCSWICSTFCPDGAVLATPEGVPRIDYDHCKGCMICASVCPHHAIASVLERDAS